MADSISSIRIPDLLDSLRDGEYLVPQFQREFVWSTADVISLLTSIIDSRPIGMLTLWEQPDDSGLDLEHISIPDGNSGGEEAPLEYFGDKDARVKKSYAVLDGRQRSTAIAMAFGGLRPKDARRKFAGKYFLNVAADDPIDRIVFKKMKEIEAQKLDVLANAISAGLFPFEADTIQFPDLDKQWMSYSRSISDSKFYADGIMPSDEELKKRIEIIDEAFNGIIDTSLAVYTVPKKYDLGTICEIFETLNTTGTKVSTVDLIHSWLYADTHNRASGPLLLREWIGDLGHLNGAFGWANPDKRPELIAQITTACYLAESKPPPPRKYGGKETKIASLKSGDLLATPSTHWAQIISKQEEFATYLGDFQKCVAGGSFPMEECSYPIISGIYVALRWAKIVDAKNWAIDDINSLFGSFFWRASISSRYDQGVVSKTASDLNLLIKTLNKRSDFEKYSKWVAFANETLDDNISPPHSVQSLALKLLVPKASGAAAKALMLPIRVAPKKDLLNPSNNIHFGSAAEQVQLHHIYPKAWVRDNFLKDDLEKWNEAGVGHMDCLANMTPMTRTSNLAWRAKVPGVALESHGVDFLTYKMTLGSHFIDQDCFDMLVSGQDDLPKFWKLRAELIAQNIASRMVVTG